MDQVTYNSNGTACASSDSDSSIHQGTQDSKQLPVGANLLFSLVRLPVALPISHQLQLQLSGSDVKCLQLHH
jgi:hypothetical protein